MRWKIKAFSLAIILSILINVSIDYLLIFRRILMLITIGHGALRARSPYGNYPLAEARLHKAGTLSWTQESMSSKQYSVDTSIYGVLVTVSFFPNKFGLFSEFLNCFLFLECSKWNKILFTLVTLSRCENDNHVFAKKYIYH